MHDSRSHVWSKPTWVYVMSAFAVPLHYTQQIVLSCIKLLQDACWGRRQFWRERERERYGLQVHPQVPFPLSILKHHFICSCLAKDKAVPTAIRYITTIWKLIPTYCSKVGEPVHLGCHFIPLNKAIAWANHILAR